MRHLFDPIPFRTHRRTLELLETAEPGRVLEIGCAEGELTRHISALGHEVTGIEVDAERAKEARRWCHHLIIGDVETVPLPPGRFDFILLTDVLEHLLDPEATLRRLLPLLAPGGRLFIAIPNVAHWSVRLQLLRGRFEYEDTGILDRTHLHFYTMSSARELLERAGVVVLLQDLVPDVPLLRYRPALARWNYRVAAVMPGLLATEALFIGRSK